MVSVVRYWVSVKFMSAARPSSLAFPTGGLVRISRRVNSEKGYHTIAAVEEGEEIQQRQRREELVIKLS